MTPRQGVRFPLTFSAHGGTYRVHRDGRTEYQCAPGKRFAPYSNKGTADIARHFDEVCADLCNTLAVRAAAECARYESDAAEFRRVAALLRECAP